MCYSWFLKIHDFFLGGRLFGGEGDDQRRCWVPLQGNNFISYLPSIFRNNIEFCFELPCRRYTVLYIDSTQNWVLLSGVYAGIIELKMILPGFFKTIWNTPLNEALRTGYKGIPFIVG